MRFHSNQFWYSLVHTQMDWSITIGRKRDCVAVESVIDKPPLLSLLVVCHVCFLPSLLLKNSVYHVATRVLMKHVIARLISIVFLACGSMSASACLYLVQHGSAIQSGGNWLADEFDEGLVWACYNRWLAINFLESLLLRVSLKGFLLQRSTWQWHGIIRLVLWHRPKNPLEFAAAFHDPHHVRLHTVAAFVSWKLGRCSDVQLCQGANAPILLAEGCSSYNLDPSQMGPCRRTSASSHGAKMGGAGNHNGYMVR